VRTWRVGDVMSADVARVAAETPYREIVDRITGRHISAVPVVDSFGRVLGVVSEADLLHKVELVGEPHERRVFESRRRRNARVKADALTAADLMTAPAIVTYADTTVVAAAKSMDRERVKRLPVIDSLGRLIGIVTRSDLLRVHLRPDADIRSDVVDEVLRRVLGVDDDIVSVEVDDGVVRLTGQLDTRSSVELAARLAANVSGVVALINELSFARDDSLLAELSGPGHPLGGTRSGR
jgi:CBS-domain-containing membrane protein